MTAIDEVLDLYNQGKFQEAAKRIAELLANEQMSDSDKSTLIGIGGIIANILSMQESKK